MRKVLLIIAIAVPLTAAALWKLGILEPLLWRSVLHVGPIKAISKHFIKFRPKGLPGPLLNQDVDITELVGATIDKDKVALRISKSRYSLTVMYDGRPLKEYSIVLGGDPVGDKVREGDKRTPEGHLTVRGLYPHRRWSKFIWLDYPNKESWLKHELAKTKGEISAAASIGGEVGIHGVPTGLDRLVDEGINWTAGCISLKTKDVDELYSVSQVGTPVLISH